MLCICPSIHPKHNASSNASAAVIVVVFLDLSNKSQTPSFDRQFIYSHFLNSALLLNLKISLILKILLMFSI